MNVLVKVIVNICAIRVCIDCPNKTPLKYLYEIGVPYTRLLIIHNNKYYIIGTGLTFYTATINPDTSSTVYIIYYYNGFLTY